MQKYSGRIPAIHLHDTKRDSSDAEVGYGVIDVNAVFDFASSQNDAWVIYEQVNGEISPLESVKLSIDYVLARKGHI